MKRRGRKGRGGAGRFWTERRKEKGGRKGREDWAEQVVLRGKNKEKMKEDWACWRKRKEREKRGKWTGPKEREKVEKEKKIITRQRIFS